MKFSNGCWLQKERCECFSPAEVYFSKIEKDQVTICAPTSKITQRGDTLGGINLTIVISAPYEEVLRVQTYHHMGVQKKAPSFEIAPAESGHLKAEDTEDKLVISSGTLRLEVQKENGALTFYRGEEKITASGWRDLAYMKTDWKGFAYDKGPEDAYMREQLSLSVGELIYGLGERFSAFVKNGQSVDIWNEDGGTSTEQSYKNIPFYISNKGYGVFVNHPERVSFEVATEMVTKVEFSVPGENLDYFLINGPTMKEVLMRYTDITGKPSLPAPWTFGLWLSTSFTTNYDEKTVNSFVDGMFDRKIPLSVFHFDCFWMKDFNWCDFTWDSRVFPDPEGMLKRLKAKGLKICVWINSYVGQESSMFKEGVEGGYFLKRPNGDVWQWDMWQPGLAIVDFTNPAACEWYSKKLEALLDMGVDCFKTDFGERIPTDAVYYDGDGGVQMNIQELATAVLEELPVILCIFNNEYLGMVRQWQKLFYGKRYAMTNLRAGALSRRTEGMEYPQYTPDFIRLAESYRAKGIRVTKKEEIAAAFEEAKKNTKAPTVIEFIIDPEEMVYPMIKPGGTLEDMIMDC